MKIIIMGTGPFAVPASDRLLSSGYEIPLVVTRPLAKSAAKKLPPRPVYDWARSKDLRIFEPESINASSAISELALYSPDLFFVCDYGQILSRDCLSTARLGGINLHGSILPRHRGAAPVQWTLLRGDTEAGLTVIHMTPRLDAGPALSIIRTPIHPDESAAELEPRLANLGVAATIESVRRLEQWDGSQTLGECQDQALVTRAPRFSKADGQLDFRLPADYLVRLVRACQPWPGTFAELILPNDKRIRVIVRAARAVDDLSGRELDSPFSEAAQPGAVTSVKAEQLGLDWSGQWQKLIATQTSNGLFLIGQLQPAGKRAMSAEEFLRGHAMKDGCRFELPEQPSKRLDAG